MSQSSAPPDFYQETSVRNHAGVSILVNGIALVGLVVLHLIVLDKLEFPFSWCVWIFGPMVVALLVWSALVWRKGGVYRAVVQNGKLTIESPDRSMFGQSQKIPLASIEILEIRKQEEGVDQHWIILTDGREICLDETWNCKPFINAKRLFRVITHLDDRIPVKTK